MTGVLAAQGELDFVLMLVAFGIAMGIGVVGHMLYTHRRLRALEERALREASRAAVEAVPERRAMFFKRYLPDEGEKRD